MHYALIFAAAFAAGSINSVGGTLITCPTLLWLGVSSKLANGTSTVALWPGGVAGAWGFRRELAEVDRRLLSLIVPSLIGGVFGALLLVLTPLLVSTVVQPAIKKATPVRARIILRPDKLKRRMNKLLR